MANLSGSPVTVVAPDTYGSACSRCQRDEGHAPRKWPTLGSMTSTRAAASAASGVTGAVIAGHLLPMLDRARIYACGITPYDVTHLGHAATFVWIDALSRALRFLGVEPELCRNITDVDDVLDAAAQRERALRRVRGSPAVPFRA